MEGLQEFPDTAIKLMTKKGRAHFVKMDIFQRKMWYAYQDKAVGGIVELSLDRVLEIIKANKSGEKPEKLEQLYENSNSKIEVDYENVVGQDRIDRFDKKKKDTKEEIKEKAVALGLKTTNNNKKREKLFFDTNPCYLLLFL